MVTRKNYLFNIVFKPRNLKPSEKNYVSSASNNARYYFKYLKTAMHFIAEETELLKCVYNKTIFTF